MIVISDSTNEFWAKSIAKAMQCKFLSVDTKQYLSGEIKITIPKDISGNDVLVVKSTQQPVNDHIIELLLLIDAIKNANAKEIHLLIPYFSYGRENHLKERESFGAKVIADLINVSAVNKVFIVDLHDEEIKNHFNMPVINIIPTPNQLFANYENIALVAPDAGSKERVMHLKKVFNKPVEIVFLNKNRKGDTCEINIIDGNPFGKNCFIIDDIIDTGNTLIAAAKVLQQTKAKSVNAIITHAVGRFDSNDFTVFLDNLFVSNSIEKKNFPDTIKIYDIIPDVIREF